METVRKKIGFYSLKLKNVKKKDEFIDPKEMKKVLAYILKLPEAKRVKTVKSKASNKFHFFRKQSLKGDIHKILFSSAKYNHRPPLIDKDSASRRNNPKTLVEGEEERTHIVFRYFGDEILILIEEHRSGITINAVMKYLMEYGKKYYESLKNKRPWVADLSVIPKDNFLAEMKKLSRITLGEIHTDKKLLGSEFLNYSNKTECIKDDLVISVKAETKRSILEPLMEVYKKYLGKDKTIHKIRVRGTNEYGNSVLLDTDIIKKIQHIDANRNEKTGVIQSRDFFTELVEIIEEV